MKKNIGLLKKIKLFSSYRNTLKSLEGTIGQNFGIRVDGAYRMYTVLNIPEEIIGDAFSIKKSDIDRISDNYIKKYISDLSAFANQNGMSELLDVYEIKKVDKYSYLVVIGFSLFRSNRFYDTLYWRVYPIVGLLAISALILLLL